MVRRCGAGGIPKRHCRGLFYSSHPSPLVAWVYFHMKRRRFTNCWSEMWLMPWQRWPLELGQESLSCGGTSGFMFPLEIKERQSWIMEMLSRLDPVTSVDHKKKKKKTRDGACLLVLLTQPLGALLFQAHSNSKLIYTNAKMTWFKRDHTKQTLWLGIITAINQNGYRPTAIPSHRKDQEFISFWCASPISLLHVKEPWV